MAHRNLWERNVLWTSLRRSCDEFYELAVVAADHRGVGNELVLDADHLEHAARVVKRSAAAIISQAPSPPVSHAVQLTIIIMFARL
jgi:uncharacterized protein (UPF0212 family)